MRDRHRDGPPPRSILPEGTSHYRITRGILEDPERSWRAPRDGGADGDER